MSLKKLSTHFAWTMPVRLKINIYISLSKHISKTTINSHVPFVGATVVEKFPVGVISVLFSIFCEGFILLVHCKICLQILVSFFEAGLSAYPARALFNNYYNQSTSPSFRKFPWNDWKFVSVSQRTISHERSFSTLRETLKHLRREAQPKRLKDV